MKRRSQGGGGVDGGAEVKGYQVKGREVMRVGDCERGERERAEASKRLFLFWAFRLLHIQQAIQPTCNSNQHY